MAAPQIARHITVESQKKVIEIAFRELRGDGKSLDWNQLSQELGIIAPNFPRIQIEPDSGSIYTWTPSNLFYMVNCSLYSQEDIALLATACIKKYFPNGSKIT